MLHVARVKGNTAIFTPNISSNCAPIWTTFNGLYGQIDECQSSAAELAHCLYNFDADVNIYAENANTLYGFFKSTFTESEENLAYQIIEIKTSQ